MTVEGLNAEERLLLCCARTRLDDETTARIGALLRQGIDWQHLFRIARQHRVVPLLYGSLNTICPEAVPPSVLAQLRDYFHANLVRNYYLTAELLKLLHLLEAHQIPAIPLKGPVLAASVYGDVSLREFVDLDILVREQDVHMAEDMIVSQGYEPEKRMTHTQRTAALQVRPHREFVRSDGKVHVELHWSLLGWPFVFPLSLDALWQQSRQAFLEEATIRSLSPEDLLLFLCVHGSKHLWENAGWICDVAELVHVHHGLDWEKTLAQASMVRSQRRLLLGLCLARELLGAPLPEHIWHRIEANPQVRALAARVRKELFCNHPISVADRFIFNLQTIERKRDSVQHCLRHLLLFAWIDQALDPPSDRLRFLYQLIERVPGKNVWIWPMPIFALLSWFCHPLTPIRRAAHAAAAWGRGVLALYKQALVQ